MAHRTTLNLLLAAAGLVAVIVLVTRSHGSPGIEVEVRYPAPGIDELRVDVAGAVAHPGVVIVSPGERVADAIARTGGVTAEAYTAALNLSRRLVDEDHIIVPRRGERAALLDLNHATEIEIEALPGIGPVYANAIVSARDTNGPFISTDELVERDIIPARVYEQIRDLVAVY